MIEEQKQQVNNLFWWHRIKLTEDFTTPGTCPHGTGEDVETRFGLPPSLKEKTVLDVGAWDGLFSFEAEKRGANHVTAIDFYQRPNGEDSIEAWEANKPFRLAKEILNSDVDFRFSTLQDFSTDQKFDYIFYFGVLYHVTSPLDAVKQLSKLVKENGVVLIETTVTDIETTKPILEYRPNWDNDPTNQFYTNQAWIDAAFKQRGAKSTTLVWTDKIRATFRIQF